MPNDQGPWNSLERTKFGLEIVKLIVGALVALAVWQLGDAASKARDKEATTRSEQARIDAQVKAVVDQRLKIWERVAPGVNEIYIYFVRYGNWKALDGRKILAQKRGLDALMFSNQIMWSPTFFKTYENFMAATFKTFRGPGLDAALRTTHVGRKERLFPEIEFTDEDKSGEVYDTYWTFQKAAATELHVDIPDLPSRDKVMERASAVSPERK